jgi:CheY-like chemotaxis protein
VLRISSPESPSAILFSVVDTGLGIAPEKISTLFDPFVQADSSTTRRFGGSGLGLSIVRRFVDAMGGAIDVQSTLGSGSAFLITLPCEVTSAPETDAPPPEIHPVATANGRRGLTVLLAEDNNVNQMIFQKMLIRLGCEVILARHGREALEALRTEEVDLVLMDCQMPELDGYQTTREIRAWGGSFATLPVIALTASAMAEDRQNCIDAGMDDFLSKPLMISKLEATLTHWSRRVDTPTESQP